MKTAVLAILLFCIMIFPHELGHFIAAKRMGVRVLEFAFGMGPTIWKHQGEETLYSIRLFPVGGFCAMDGEDGSGEETEDGTPVELDPRTFEAKKPWQRIIVLAAGSVMNILCAILIMALVLGISGFTTNRIDQVAPGGPAETAGIQAGDKITEINGDSIKNWNDVINHMPQDGAEMKITVKNRDGSHTVSVQPALQPSVDAEGNAAGEHYVIGITSKVSHSPIKALGEGAKATWNLVKLMFKSISMLISGEAGADDLSGPVGMVQMVSKTETLGFWYYGFLISLICVNLAIINMLPLPALDGGRILFILFTLITGKKVSAKVEGTVHAVGMALLIGLMVYVTFNDITRIFG